MYGRTPILPIDVEFGVTLLDLQSGSHKNYVDKLKTWLKWEYKIAHDTNAKEAKCHKCYYDQKFKCMKIEVGDIVLVCVKAFGPDQKVTDRWEQQPYEVVGQIPDKPVFTVCKVGSSDVKDECTLHRNMLFPLESAQLQSSVIDGQAQSNKLIVANQLMVQMFDC